MVRSNASDAGVALPPLSLSLSLSLPPSNPLPSLLGYPRLNLQRLLVAGAPTRLSVDPTLQALLQFADERMREVRTSLRNYDKCRRRRRRLP